MAKPQSDAANYVTYLLVRVIVCIVQALSFAAACRFAELLGWLAYHINKRHREVARDNLRRAFPGKAEAQIDHIVRQVYRHFCTVVVEIAHLPRRLHLSNWKKHIDLVDGERIVDRMLSGRPLLLVTGHIGNWELGGFILGLFGFSIHAIARPLDNPYLDDYLRKFREKTGGKLLAKRGDFDHVQAILRSGGVLGTLADQDAGQRGLFVDFFGRPASTHKAVALLALEHRVPMAVVGTAKIDGRYRILVEDVILPEDYENHPDSVRAITQRFTTALERMIQLAPEQYFWLHRRWKHAPPKARRKTAAA